MISEWQYGATIFRIRTSGSTGIPKEIELSRKLLVWSARSTYQALEIHDIAEREGMICCLPVSKTGGFMMLIRALVWEWNIHFENPVGNPSRYFAQKKYSLTSLSPTQLDALVEDKSLDNSPSIALVGGARVSHDLQQKIASATCTVYETYGMTETASNIALRKLESTKTFFKPHKGVVLQTKDNQLKVSIPELNLEVQTTDIVKIHTSGFEIIGRSDDVINSGGIKIHPSLIEPLISKLLSDAGIDRRIYLAKKKDLKLGEKAILVMEGIAMKNTSFILELMKRELPMYQNPKEILFLEKIAFTDTGKVIRKAY